MISFPSMDTKGYTYFTACDSLYRINTVDINWDNIPSEVLDKWIETERNNLERWKQRKQSIIDEQERKERLKSIKEKLFLLSFCCLNLIGFIFSIVSFGLNGILFGLFLSMLSIIGFGMSGILNEFEGNSRW